MTMYKQVERILIICDDEKKAKRIELSLGDQFDSQIVESGRKGIDCIKKSSVSIAFLPLDLVDMDFFDFIRFSKRISPDTLFIIVTEPSLPDVSFLVAGHQIDGFISEPLSVSKVLMTSNNVNEKKVEIEGGFDGNLALMK